MSSQSFRKGDIIRGDGAHRGRNEAFHPIVYLKGELSVDFEGVMLTKSRRFPNNVFLPKAYIKTEDDEGKSFSFKANRTHFVKVKLLKPTEWGPYHKVGELTDEGIAHIERETSGMTPIYWEDYLKENRQT